MLIPALLVVCFLVGLFGVMSTRTDGSGLYLAFCVLSPVLVPVWLGMQLGEWIASPKKKVVSSAASVAPRMRTRAAYVRPIRPRAMTARPSCVAKAS